MNRNVMVTIILFVATLALQIFVSPLLNIGGTTINYCLAFISAISIAMCDKPKIVVCIILGLFMDLTQGEPFGAFTLIFLLASTTATNSSANITTSRTSEKSLLTFVICAVANILHCFIVGLATPGLSLVLAFTSGKLISCLFDGLVSILYLIIASMLTSSNKDIWSTRL